MTELKNWNLIEEKYIEEIDSTMCVYEHKKVKTKLLWEKNKDTNKLFSIAFKTIPHNDTGVFHILEHSVLCGSEKYPVREPFVELLKSSMNTFLNAMTFPDKTLYPVSSRNDQDYLNLMDVYLDAVFAPAIFTNPNIFYQEGWHYEFDEAEGASVNGVVYNEMKGAEASTETLIGNEIRRMLYPDTYYGYISGGDTKYIPTLTYDQFIEEYKTYYHPTNAIIYLAGDVPLEATIQKIDAYLDTFECSDKVWNIELQKDVLATEKKHYYAINEEVDETNYTQIIFAKIVCTFAEKNKLYAMQLLGDYLAQDNTSPLTKAILDKGLAEDVSFSISEGIAQPDMSIQITNTNESKKDEIKQVIRDVISDLVNNGIDKDVLEAIINQSEFSFRDPYEPKALYHNISVLASYLYGGDYSLYLEYNETFKFLREQLSTNYYEELLKEMFDETYMHTLILLPSKTYLNDCIKEEKERVNSIVSTFTQEDYARYYKQNEQLNAWQVTPDTPEQLATIPKLEITQVNEKPEKVEYEEIRDNMYYYPFGVPGIVYYNQYFEIGNLTHTDLPMVDFLTKLLSNVPTKNRTLFELKNDIQKYIGGLSFSATTSSKGKDDCIVYINVCCSVIEQNVDKANEIISDILLNSNFDDINEIHSNLAQYSYYLRNESVENGHQNGLMDASQYYSKEYYVKNQMLGIPGINYLIELNDCFDDKKDEIITTLKKIINHSIYKNHCMMSICMAKKDMSLYDTLLAPYKEIDALDTNVTMAPLTRENRLSKIVMDTSYATLACDITEIGGTYSGTWKVISKIISLCFLWNEIRVQGGAYGTGMRINRDEVLGFYSYRDPSPKHSIEVYKQVGKWLEGFLESEENFDSYIISSIADFEPLFSPKQVMMVQDLRIFKGTTYEMQCKLRKEILAFNKEDALQCIKVLNNMIEHNTQTIVTSAKNMDDFKDYKLI